MDILDTIVELSHEFGDPAYVKGGGGNTSCKDAETLWVKPSGTTLPGMTRENFVAMDRAILRKLFDAEPPADPSAREAFVKEHMAGAVRPDSSGRASVEAPLHESFDATFVVHTHPAAVNGMTCGQNGEAACRELFPDALWAPYTDPGYTLSMAVREAMQQYRTEHGAQPELVFLQNHGVFVAAPSAEKIRELYRRVMETVGAVYSEKKIAAALPAAGTPDPEKADAAAKAVRDLLGPDAAHVKASGAFALFEGPLSPDHIVYAKSYPLTDLTPEGVAKYRAERGYAPRVIRTGEVVLGAGATEKNARLALEFAQDGALVRQLAEAFGGVRYLDDRARGFIENWEVEAYRQKVIEA